MLRDETKRPGGRRGDVTGGHETEKDPFGGLGKEVVVVDLDAICDAVETDSAPPRLEVRSRWIGGGEFHAQLSGAVVGAVDDVRGVGRGISELLNRADGRQVVEG